MNSKFLYVGIIMSTIGLSSCSTNKDHIDNLDINEKHVDEFGSEWTYVEDNYPYWMIYNSSHNTYCRYYPYSGMFTNNINNSSRMPISKPDYISQGMVNRANSINNSTERSKRPRTDYHREYYGGGYNNGVSNFATGYILGTMLSNSSNHTYYGGSPRVIREVHYINNNNNVSANTKTVNTNGLKYAPVKSSSSFGNRVNSSSSKINSSSSSSNKNSVSTSSKSNSSTKSSSRAGFGSTGRSSGSSAAS
ncbi:MAG: hypothetical protein RSE41_02440 [Clostridia bacterium]